MNAKHGSSNCRLKLRKSSVRIRHILIAWLVPKCTKAWKSRNVSMVRIIKKPKRFAEHLPRERRNNVKSQWIAKKPIRELWIALIVRLKMFLIISFHNKTKLIMYITVLLSVSLITKDLYSASCCII